MDRSFDDEKSIRYKGEGSDSAYSLRRKGGGDSADAHSLRRKGEVAETLGLRVSPVDFESSADLNGQKGVSKSWVSDSMLPALMQKIDPSEKRALMRKGEGFCYRGHIAKYIADHTPPPLDDPELLARHDRCMEVEKMAVRNMTAQGKNIEAWMQSAILPDEETILAMECSTFRNVISCPDKVGDGMVCVTQHKTTQKHRLHFFMMEEKASFHASETDSELGCLFRILGVNGESSYTSTRSRTSFCSVISVEECVLHVSERPANTPFKPRECDHLDVNSMCRLRSTTKRRARLSVASSSTPLPCVAFQRRLQRKTYVRPCIASERHVSSGCSGSSWSRNGAHRRSGLFLSDFKMSHLLASSRKKVSTNLQLEFETSSVSSWTLLLSIPYVACISCTAAQLTTELFRPGSDLRETFLSVKLANWCPFCKLTRAPVLQLFIGKRRRPYGGWGAPCCSPNGVNGVASLVASLELLRVAHTDHQRGD
mmetsp:Transcript_19393/g.46534  ORF Transcript_19393/g.46534 Transcript_19393/m.46534 type:complete len:483 (-) Transcript_19393:469-1917(-)